MTYNPAHILASTFLLAVLIVFGFAHLAHAETLLIDTTAVGATSSVGLYNGGYPHDHDEAVQWFTVSENTNISRVSVYIDYNQYSGTSVTYRGYLYRQDATTTDLVAPIALATSPYTLTATNTGQWYDFTFNEPVTRSATYGFGIRAYDMQDGDGVNVGARYVSVGDYGTLGMRSWVTTYDGGEFYSGYSQYFMNMRVYGGAGIGDDEYLITFAPCATDTRDNELTVCEKDFQEQPTFSWAVNTTEPNRKIELQARTVNGRLLDSVAYYYTDAGFYTGTTSITLIGTTTKVVAEIRTCLLPGDGFLGWDSTAKCTTMIFGNGTTTGSYPDWFCKQHPELEICNPEGKTMYELMNCQDVSILSVASSTYCALLWAFEPSYSSLQKFDRAKNLLLYSYPIGYFTFMWTDIQTAFTSTSTDIFTREIELGKYFGRPNTATTTLTLAGSETYIEKIKPVTDKVNILLWIGFSVWFIIWAVTRKL